MNETEKAYRNKNQGESTMSKRSNEEPQDHQLFMTEGQKEVKALLTRLRHAIEKSVSCKDKDLKEEWTLLIAELTEQIVAKTGKIEYITLPAAPPTTPYYPITIGDGPSSAEPTITWSDSSNSTAYYTIDGK